MVDRRESKMDFIFPIIIVVFSGMLLLVSNRLLAAIERISPDDMQPPPPLARNILRKSIIVVCVLVIGLGVALAAVCFQLVEWCDIIDVEGAKLFLNVLANILLIIFYAIIMFLYTVLAAIFSSVSITVFLMAYCGYCLIHKYEVAEEIKTGLSIMPIVSLSVLVLTSLLMLQIFTNT